MSWHVKIAVFDGESGPGGVGYSITEDYPERPTDVEVLTAVQSAKEIYRDLGDGEDPGGMSVQVYRSTDKTALREALRDEIEHLQTPS